MTEENARPGDAGLPEVPPAMVSGERSTVGVPPAPPASGPVNGRAPGPVPAGTGAAPGTVPPKPSTPPTSATPIVPRPAPGPAPGLSGQAHEAHDGPAAPERTQPRPGTSPGAVISRAAAWLSATFVRLGRWLRRQSPARIGAAAVAVAVVVVGLLVWMLSSTLGGAHPSAAESSPAPAASPSSSAPASRGALPLEGVGPLDFQLGDCFKDFDPDALQSTVVECSTGHSAQLIAVHEYQASDAYPGLNALKDKGRETCRNARLAAAATSYELLQRNAYPSSSSWGNGDRRVDCYVVAKTGNVIMESLRP